MSSASSPKMAPQAAKKTLPKEPTFDEIRARAYEIFVARADSPGDEIGDWLLAERELLAEQR